jgi:hypothetical protein
MSGLDHARSCPECGLRLAAERRLNRALVFAAEAEVEGSPPSVKAAIMSEFAGQRVPAMSSSPVSDATGTKAMRMPWLVLAAAAVLLILFAAVTFYMIRSRAAGPHTLEPAPSGPVAGNPPNPTVIQPPQDAAGTVDSMREAAPPPPHSGPRKKSLNVPLASSRERDRPEPLADSNAGSRIDLSADSEAMTDFIPLTYLTRSTAIESGQVMRVRVPLSTFISLGVPINTQRSDELVNAELVVGDDGVMRAVRLVK